MTSERTPLLQTEPHQIEGGHSSELRLLSIEEYWDAIRITQNVSLATLHDLLDPAPIPSHSRFALMLLLLLFLRGDATQLQPLEARSVRQKLAISEAKEQRNNLLDNILRDVLREAEGLGEDSICLMLITPFETTPTSAKANTRMIDHLHNSQVLLNNEVILGGLTMIWEGRSIRNGSRFGLLIRSITSPRSCYAFATLLHLLFLSSIVHFTLNPSVPMNTTRRLVENVYVLLYAGSACLQSPTKSMLPTALIFTIYVSRIFLSAPMITSLYLVLLALALLGVQLQVPTEPSPPSILVLIAPQHTLSLGSLIAHKATDALLPSIMFITPLAIFSLISLSLSLNGIPSLPHTLTLQSAFWSPFPTRVFYLSMIMGLLMLMFILFSIIALTGVKNHDLPELRWNEYGSAVGHTAKQRWVRTVAHWTVTRTMIAPPLFIVYLMVQSIVHLKSLRRG